jgi:two-component system sensor histidine kinase PilS (NtrC family)
VLAESDRINCIVTDYLAYARPRVNEAVSVDLGEVLTRALEEARALPDIRPDHIVETHWPEFPMLLKADAQQLTEAFGHLARNSFQAMPEGGTLRVEVQAPTPQRRRIVFQDTGRGMPPEQLAQIFEPFNSTNGGTGLGLPIVYQIIREHGGSINVSSREGQGTAITVELPLES